MPCRTITAAAVAAPFAAEIAAAAASASTRLHIAAFLASSDPAAALYADVTRRACDAAHLRFSLHRVDREALEDAVVAANADPEVHGILVYYPVFGDRQDQYLQSVVSPAKDIEALGHTYLYNLYHNVRYLDPPHNTRKSIIPCTPLAVVKVLEHLNVYNTLIGYGDRLHGKTIAVINRSEVVGRPLAAMMANDGARVFSIDIDSVQEFSRGAGIQHPRHVVTDTTLTLHDVLPLCDVVVAAVPAKDYKVPVDRLKEGVIAINVSSFKNFAPADITCKAALYVPSVGKVTVAMLQRNLLRLYQHQLAAS